MKKVIIKVAIVAVFALGFAAATHILPAKAEEVGTFMYKDPGGGR